MMNERFIYDTKEYLYKFLGRPDEYTFNIKDYMGNYGGLINVTGLRHKNIVIAGNTLYTLACEHFGIELDRWEFLYELGNWSCEFVGNDEVKVGKQFIVKGQIDLGSTRYFCIPSNLQCLKQDEESHASN